MLLQALGAQVAGSSCKRGSKARYRPKVVEFSDYVTPDKALAGWRYPTQAHTNTCHLDENFNKQNGSWTLVAIGRNDFNTPMGIV